jgi:probable rRNA maturation factor
MIEIDLVLQIQTDIASSTDEAGEMRIATLTESQWQHYFEQWINALNPQQSKIQAYEVSLLLTTDTEIQTLNAAYRQQDRPTDVLAFAALEWDGPTSPEMADLSTNLGDIAISVDTAALQAAENGHDLSLELIWLASHGLLHLLGWDHPDAAQLNQMLTEQARLIELIGLKAPLWSAQTLGYR